ncbi:hypothetical protein YQE_10142, partial [Dendroctonus ponderosae]
MIFYKKCSLENCSQLKNLEVMMILRSKRRLPEQNTLNFYLDLLIFKIEHQIVCKVFAKDKVFSTHSVSIKMCICNSLEGNGLCILGQSSFLVTASAPGQFKFSKI